MRRVRARGPADWVVKVAVQKQQHQQRLVLPAWAFAAGQIDADDK